MATNYTGPHVFKPLGRIRHRKSCRFCLATENEHPILNWAVSRALGDKSPPQPGGIRRRGGDPV